MEPTVHQIELLCHALGISGAKLEPYRNYFAASPDSPDYNHWQELAKAELAVCRGSRGAFGELIFFSVTDAGEVLARRLACSRKPKPLSRAKQTYQDYINASEWFNGTFGEYLKYKSKMRKCGV